ncbi:choice-of-anchor Q domain-containing protein [Marinicella sp. W31]|uniref:choice-of-anchor Q domain-containing protein n=1 Tax=Marinicella sp. W31 TaxID=3023713 RepID=UPI00375785E4
MTPVSFKLKHLTKSISLALIVSTTAHSAEFIVTTNGDQGGGIAVEVDDMLEVNTLRSAIELADNESAFPGADTIRFDDSIVIGGEAEINLNIIGDTFNTSFGNSNSAFGINSEISVIGPQFAELVLTAGDLRHFQVNAGGKLNLSHMTLDDGFAPPNFSGSGGAILAIADSVLNVSHCTFSNNQAASGGAISIDSNNSINQSSIQFSRFINNRTTPNNSSTRVGGAIRIDSENLPFIVRNSTFSENTSERAGGAVFHSSHLIIEASTIHNNTAVREGGGISGNNRGVLTLINSTIANNKSDSRGGGIEINTEPGAGINTIINSTITGNQSRFNESDESPSVFQHRLGDGEIGFDTSGGGVYVADYVDTTIIHNSIIAGNTETTAMLPDDMAASPIPESSNNLIGAGDSVLGISDGVNGNQIGTQDVPIDADLKPLAGNGGRTPTQLPNLGSPVIDAGNDVLCAEIDQRSRLRPADGDTDGTPKCDIGAVELGGISDLIFSNGFEVLEK